MERLDQRVMVVFFLKFFLATFYVVPIWFIGVSVFENYLRLQESILPITQIIWILNGAGIIFLIGLLVLCYYAAWFTYLNYSYALTSDGLHINKGLLFKQQSHLAFTDINSVQVYANPFIGNVFGIYSLVLKTRQRENTEGIFAKAHTEVLPGLTLGKARYMHDELIKGSHSIPVQKTFFDPVSGKHVQQIST